MEFKTYVKARSALPAAIICDIDGTLAHISDGRSPYDASRAMNDSLDDAIASIIDMYYAHDYKIIILTGRSAEHLDVTVEWLAKHSINYNEIYTRAEGDNRKDSIVKKELYSTHIAPRFNVKFVLDDRNQVVDMWRNELGLKCLQVAEGDF